MIMDGLCILTKFSRPQDDANGHDFFFAAQSCHVQNVSLSVANLPLQLSIAFIE